MNPLFELSQVEFKSLSKSRQAELEKLSQDFRETQPGGNHGSLIIGNQARCVVSKVLFQRGMLKQIRHHRFWIGTWFQVQYDPQVMLVIGFVVGIKQLRQLAGIDNRTNLCGKRT